MLSYQLHPGKPYTELIPGVTFVFQVFQIVSDLFVKEEEKKKRFSFHSLIK